MTRIIVLPDEGEWVLVPKVATDEMVRAGAQYLCVCGTIDAPRGLQASAWDGTARQVIENAFAAAPPCKVVELPEREEIPMHNCCDIERALGRNEVLDEIERRAK